MPLLVSKQSETGEYVSHKEEAKDIEDDPYLPKEEFMWIFSQKLEDSLRGFDDAIIQFIQHLHTDKAEQNCIQKAFAGFFYGFSLLMTCITITSAAIKYTLDITQIENGPSLAIIFLVLGMDYYAV